MDVGVGCVALGLGVLVVVIKIVYDEIGRRKGPPGPWPLPFFGNLLSFIRRPGPLVLTEYFSTLRNKYGDIFALRIGNRDVVVINGFQNVKEALCNPKYCMNGRPRILWTEITGGKGLFSSDGHLWNEQRKAVMHMLHKQGFDESHRCQDAVAGEVNALCEGLVTAASAADGCVEPQCHLDAALCNVSSVVVLGRRFDACDPFFKAVSGLLDEVFLHAGIQNMANYLPLLRYLPGDPYKCHALRGHASTAAGYIQSVIAERRAVMEESSYSDTTTFLDTYLSKIKQACKDPTSTFTEDQLLMTAIDLFAMSIEAPSTTMRWALLLLAQNQDVQSRLHEEIEAKVGLDRAPTLADSEGMPYMKAFIAELHRHANVVALNLPHCATADVTFKGYTIKKGAIIIPNLTSIHYDADLFPEPEKFNPDRFSEASSSNSGTEPSIVPNLHDFVVPFSLGPRICLGMAIARAEMFLFLTGILQRLSIMPCAAATSVRRHGLIESPSKFAVRVVRRNGD